MAAENRSTGFTRGTIEVSRTQDTRADIYTGTKKALIAARICRPDWFPAKLVAKVRRDGKPHMGNNGRQRITRTYVVEGHKPETTLRHRVDAMGAEFWEVRVSCSDVERASREQKLQRENEERQRGWAATRERNAKLEADRERVAATPAMPGADAPISSRAAFEVGDSAILHEPGGADHLARVKVVSPYGVHSVNYGDGATGREWGYVITVGEKRFFVSPHQLRDRADKPAHLKLVPEPQQEEEQAPEKCPHCGVERDRG